MIPTFNRLDVLRVTLGALDAQEGIGTPLEIVVVDDGSEDETWSWLETWQGAGHHRVAVRSDHAGPAVARNRGLSRCRGDRVLLLGDDTIPDAGCVARHLELGASGGVAVQGLVDWDPTIEVTRLMRFMAPEGPQFYFKGLDEGGSMPWPRMASSNLSAPRSWFAEEGFDERFPAACLEDTEMAYRWHRRGWRFVFSRRARCVHRHSYRDPEDLMRRQRRAGAEARRVIALHPRLAWLLGGQVTAGTVRAVARSLVRGLRGRAALEDRWELRWRFAYFSGLLTGSTGPGHST